MSEIPAVDVVVSFDTTGSMYPCLTQVRKKVTELCQRLFDHIPDLRVGIIAHGDYCDASSSYVTKTFDLSNDQKQLEGFINGVEATGGGDAPEAYELVLHESRSLSWRAGSTKALVMIGDERPHEADYPENKLRLDWKNELRLLQEMNVNVYGVHALAAYRKDAAHFWKAMAEMTRGYYLTLDQFNELSDMLLTICYHKTGSSELMQRLRAEISEARRMTIAMANAFETLTGERPEVNAAAAAASAERHRKAGRAVTTAVTEKDLEAYGDVKLEPVPPGRFQRLEVDHDVSIRDFVNEMIGEGSFHLGAGFYQFGGKAVKVQSYKQVVLVDKDTGEMFSGDAARKMLKLPKGADYNLKPAEVDLDKYWVFIQSTSVNRKLFKDEMFLYEVKEIAEKHGASA
jgi:hypothetical protein